MAPALPNTSVHFPPPRFKFARRLSAVFFWSGCEKNGSRGCLNAHGKPVCSIPEFLFTMFFIAGSARCVRARGCFHIKAHCPSLAVCIASVPLKKNAGRSKRCTLSPFAAAIGNAATLRKVTRDSAVPVHSALCRAGRGAAHGRRSRRGAPRQGAKRVNGRWVSAAPPARRRRLLQAAPAQKPALRFSAPASAAPGP